MDAAVLDALEIGCYDLGCFDTNSVLDVAVLDARAYGFGWYDFGRCEYSLRRRFWMFLEVMNVGCCGFGCSVNWMLRSWMLQYSPHRTASAPYQDYFTIKVCSVGKSDRRRDVT